MKLSTLFCRFRVDWRSISAIVVATFAASAAFDTAGAQTNRSPVPISTRWPQRIAVAMIGKGSLSAVTIEARTDGWVMVNFLATRPDEGLSPPPMRLMVEARDVKTWVARARRLFDLPADSLGNEEARSAPSLGNGRYHLEMQVQPDPRKGGHIWYYGCGPGSGGTSPSRREMLEFLSLLDSAAKVAGGGSGHAPTLRRVYYASEVSCPPSPQSANVVPLLPRAALSNGRREPIALGAQFVVDTSGNIEPRSIRVLPGTDSSAAQAARDAIARWHFVPAEIDGTPVRQLVQQRIVVDTAAPTAPNPGDPLIPTAEPDGWVVVRHTNAPFAQEWFLPDSVDAWVSRVDSATAGLTARGDGQPVASRGLDLGQRNGIHFYIFFSQRGGASARNFGIGHCGGAGSSSGWSLNDVQLARFRSAARAARELRAPPADPATVVHAREDVSCPAWLPWTRSGVFGNQVVWRYPTGVYPTSMAGSAARAEIMFSVVVDTAGIADLSTLSVMRESDPRAAAALRSTLRTLRFRPAKRSGVTVPERVIQSLLFESPPMCASVRAGPVCPRRYSDQ